LGLVGESGCGKSTTGNMIVKLLNPTAGKVLFRGRDISSMSNEQDREYKRNVQIIFQDPSSSLDPRQTAGKIIGEPLVINGRRREAKDVVLKLMAEVGLLEEQYGLYPHELSGGQRQRIGVARGLALNPSLIVCDEPVSALDVSIQAQIINLMQDLQQKFAFTYLFISHDLSVVKHISDRIAVMYMGRIVELAPKVMLYSAPLHPYTLGLLDAIPAPNPNDKKEQSTIEGDVPNPIDPPSGCRFHPRCPRAMDICRTQPPVMRELRDGHSVECHLYN
ncbi:MAG: ATP-binding cassette domain-containing protein, partial [Spirochaetales bacterium]|nr:ATP-binding cassette domain-containing protein [Spirochaetales bacterium]